MLDTFVIIGSLLALFFLVIGIGKKNAWALLISAIVFLVIGMGIFVTGYQTYDNAPININNTGTRITFELMTTNPVLEGTPDQQIIFTIAMFYIGLTLILIFLAIEESMKNRAAKEQDEE